MERPHRQELLKAERGAIVKDHGGKIRIALAFPNTYEVGMSNLGFQAVYALLNSYEGVVCERFFLPRESACLNDARFGRGMLRTLETNRAVQDFHVVAFSVPFENDFPNIVRLLRLARIPVRQRERTEDDPLVLMGGSAAYLNPEPVADFMDIIALGEAEPMVPTFLDLLEDRVAGRCSRREFLKELASQAAGFYVPSLHDPAVIVASREPGGFRGHLRRVRLKNLEQAPSYTRIVTPHTVFGHLFNIEIIRGCPARCRFCSVKTTQNPVRNLPVPRVLELAERGLKLTGRVGLVGPSVTAHPGIREILTALRSQKGSFSFPSVRIEDLAPWMVEAAALTGVRTLTIAPESGDVALRAALGKHYPNERVLDVARWTAEARIPALKLYFMYGVPTEGDWEVESTLDLVAKIHRERRQLDRGTRIEVSINPFIPKPQTAFQWAPLCAPKILRQRAKRLKKGLCGLPGVRVKLGALNLAPLQMIFSRGDRRSSLLVESVAEGGQPWKASFRQHSHLVEEMLQAQTQVGGPLPWDHLMSPHLRKRLERQYRIGVEGRQAERAPLLAERRNGPGRGSIRSG